MILNAGLLYEILYVLFPVLFVICISIKKDAYKNKGIFQEHNWQFKDVILLIAALALIKLIGLFAFISGAISSHNMAIYNGLIISVPLGFLAYFRVIKKYGVSLRLLGLSREDLRKNLLLLSILFFTCLLVIILFIYLLNRQESLLGKEIAAYDLRLLENSYIDYMVYIISLVLVAPVIEEIIFRGVFYAPFAKKLGSHGAIWAISFVWATVHQSLSDFLGIFLIGLILGYLYKKSLSLIPCIFFHSLKNLIPAIVSIYSFFF